MLQFPPATIEEFDAIDSNAHAAIGSIPHVKQQTFPPPHATPPPATLQRSSLQAASSHQSENRVVKQEEDVCNLESTKAQRQNSWKGVPSPSSLMLASPILTTPQKYRQSRTHTPQSSTGEAKSTLGRRSCGPQTAGATPPVLFNDQHDRPVATAESLAHSVRWKSLAEWSPGRREHWDKLRATDSPLRVTQLPSTPTLHDPPILSQSFETTPAAQAHLRSPQQTPPIHRWPPIFPFTYRYMSAWVAAQQRYFTYIQHQQLLYVQAQARLVQLHAIAQYQARRECEQRRLSQDRSANQNGASTQDSGHSQGMYRASEPALSYSACKPQTHPVLPCYNQPTGSATPRSRFVQITNRNECNEILGSQRLEFMPHTDLSSSHIPHNSDLSHGLRTPAITSRGCTFAPARATQLPSNLHTNSLQTQRTLAMPRECHSLSVPDHTKRGLRPRVNRSQSTEKSRLCAPPPLRAGQSRDKNIIPEVKASTMPAQVEHILAHAPRQHLQTCQSLAKTGSENTALGVHLGNSSSLLPPGNYKKLVAASSAMSTSLLSMYDSGSNNNFASLTRVSSSPDVQGSSRSKQSSQILAPIEGPELTKAASQKAPTTSQPMKTQNMRPHGLSKIAYQGNTNSRSVSAKKNEKRTVDSTQQSFTTKDPSLEAPPQTSISMSLQGTVSAPVPRHTIRPTLIAESKGNVSSASASVTTKKATKRKNEGTPTSKSPQGSPQQKKRQKMKEEPTSDRTEVQNQQKPSSQITYNPKGVSLQDGHTCVTVNKHVAKQEPQQHTTGRQEIHNPENESQNNKPAAQSGTPKALTEVEEAQVPSLEKAKVLPRNSSEESPNASEHVPPADAAGYLPVVQAIVPRLTGTQFKLLFPRTFTGVSSVSPSSCGTTDQESNDDDDDDDGSSCDDSQNIERRFTRSQKRALEEEKVARLRQRGLGAELEHAHSSSLAPSTVLPRPSTRTFTQLGNSDATLTNLQTPLSVSRGGPLRTAHAYGDVTASALNMGVHDEPTPERKKLVFTSRKNHKRMKSESMHTVPDPPKHPSQMPPLETASSPLKGIDCGKGGRVAQDNDNGSAPSPRKLKKRRTCQVDDANSKTSQQQV